MEKENGKDREEHQEENEVSVEEEPNEVNVEEEPAARTWRDSLRDVTEIGAACLEAAHDVLTGFADTSGTKSPSVDATVAFANTIFEAVVTAETGRIRAQAQRGLEGGLATLENIIPRKFETMFPGIRGR